MPAVRLLPENKIVGEETIQNKTNINRNRY